MQKNDFFRMITVIPYYLVYMESEGWRKNEKKKKQSFLELILSSLQLVFCRVAAIKCLSVQHHSADYILSSPLESLASF